MKRGFGKTSGAGFAGQGKAGLPALQFWDKYGMIRYKI